MGTGEEPSGSAGDAVVGRTVRGWARGRARSPVAQRAFRLAARQVRPARLPRARQDAAPGRAADRRRGRVDARGARRPGRGGRGRHFPADHRRRGRAHRARTRAARTARLAWRQAAGRPQPQRPGGHRPAPVPAGPRAARGVPARRAADCAHRAGGGERQPARARHDPPAARAARAFRPPAARPRAGVHAGREQAARLGHQGGGQPARRRGARRVLAADRPAAVRGRARLRHRRAELDGRRRRTGTSPPSSASPPR